MANLGTSCLGKTHFHQEHTRFNYIQQLDENYKVPLLLMNVPAVVFPKSQYGISALLGAIASLHQCTVVILLGILNESWTNTTTKSCVTCSDKGMLFCQHNWLNSRKRWFGVYDDILLNSFNLFLCALPSYPPYNITFESCLFENNHPKPLADKVSTVP